MTPDTPSAPAMSRRSRWPRAAICATALAAFAAGGVRPALHLRGWRRAFHLPDRLAAAHRLREAAEPLEAIAHGVGYSSEFTFSRAFTWAYGQPPWPLPGRGETAGHGI